MRSGRTSFSFLLLFMTLALPGTAANDEFGRIEGRVTRADGRDMGGVEVALNGTSEIRLTGEDGTFEFRSVPASTYTLTFKLIDNSAEQRGVVVRAGETTAVQQTVDWPVGVLETVTVRSVSRYPQSLTGAPAAVTRVSGADIARRAAHGQVPKLFEFTSGVGITQSGLYDFNIDTRGFNGALSRRVPVLLDGRDTADPFTQSPEWATLSLPLTGLADLEVLRGPSGTMWGPNATSGVLSLHSRRPKESLGGEVRLAAGQQDTINGDLRWAVGLGREWYAQVAASVRRAEPFARSRLASVEYSVPCAMEGQVDCLPPDAIAFPLDETKVAEFAVRFDKHLAGGGIMTVEGGSNDYEGTVFISPGGTRGMMKDANRGWARVDYSSDHWDVLAYCNSRDSDSADLTNGAPFVQDSHNARVEASWNRRFAGDRVRLIAGARYGDETVETPALRGGRIDNEQQALFAQVDWTVHPRVDLLAGTRWDEADVYTSAEISTRGGVVWRAAPGHGLHLIYREGFQVPTYVDYFLRFPVGPPVDLGLEAEFCSPAGIQCGLEATPQVAVGNEDLTLEKTRTFELGYRGLFGSKGLVTLDMYSTENRNFVAPLQFQNGPAGPVNGGLGPWAPASDPTIPASVVADVNAAAPAYLAAAGLGVGQLSTVDGQSVIVLLSTTNFGRVDTQGIELGFRYFPRDRWKLDVSYAWFDFDGDQGAGNSLPPNSPDNRVAAEVTYAAANWHATLHGRWTDRFRWLNGITQGTVESYATFDLLAGYSFDRHWAAGLNVANVFDDKHWQAFGGAVIRRRTLGYLTFSW